MRSACSDFGRRWPLDQSFQGAKSRGTVAWVSGSKDTDGNGIVDFGEFAQPVPEDDRSAACAS